MASDEHEPVPKHPSEAEFEAQVEKKEQRKIKAKQEGQRSIWFGLGMMGLVGWSVTIPTLIGVAIGVWIDRVSESRYSWTLMCLIFGVLLGCWNAWYWVQRQSKER
jgi:ATP synthase protein I